MKRFGGKPWTQFQATKQGGYTSFRGHGRASFIALCKMQDWEFIVPTIEMPEPMTRYVLRGDCAKPAGNDLELAWSCANKIKVLKK